MTTVIFHCQHCRKRYNPLDCPRNPYRHVAVCPECAVIKSEKERFEAGDCDHMMNLITCNRCELIHCEDCGEDFKGLYGTFAFKLVNWFCPECEIERRKT